MNRRFLIVACAALFLTGGTPSRAGEVIDRIVATVNGHIILQSDWDDALRYEAFVDGRRLDQLPTAERKAALDRLIDQELLQEQMHSSDFRHASDQEISQRIQEIRKHYSGTETEPGWQALLNGYGFTEEGLKQHIAVQMDLLRLVDARLRPNVSIDPGSIESYYNKELLPQLRQSGEQEVPLAAASSKIRELLTQQKVNQLLITWLQNLRSGSEIHTDPNALNPKGELQ